MGGVWGGASDKEVSTADGRCPAWFETCRNQPTNQQTHKTPPNHCGGAVTRNSATWENLKYGEAVLTLARWFFQTDPYGGIVEVQSLAIQVNTCIK